ncbi:MAG: hypothetical protein GF421_05040 [Candidatus Aminicenantes bacterium]|nr:hypothetical protein [Candidatus Aminicenantes bacterium]
MTIKKIFLFWVPLAATWLMMAVEGPFLAAVIARLQNPKYNLAAYGVAFSFAILIEAPIIMITSASTALVKDQVSYMKLRNFTFFLNFMVTLIMIVFLIPNVFFFVTRDLMNLDKSIAELTHQTTMFLIPWAAAIGYRRFYQGILIRNNLTRRVAYGTVFRLLTMSSVAVISYLFTSLKGAFVGGAALCCGVLAEAVISRIMAHSSIKKVNQINDTDKKRFRYRFITKFYYPLALTSILSLGIHPLVTFFMGQSRMPLESLAVLPVINSLVFIFRSTGLSFQEVGIALLDKKNKAFPVLRKFAVLLGLGASLGLSLVAFTPLSEVWFQQISGLSGELSRFAVRPTQILFLLPGLSVMLCFQRAIIIKKEKTKPVTIATAVELIGVIIFLIFTIHWFNWVGAVCAAVSMTLGRLAADIYLLRPFSRALHISAD